MSTIFDELSVEEVVTEDTVDSFIDETEAAEYELLTGEDVVDLVLSMEDGLYGDSCCCNGDCSDGNCECNN